MPDLLNNLNDEQKSAVTYTKGPLLIIAGAGTGKTTVITHKIAYIIEQKLAKPNEILALTFTDKAAGEMEERVDKLLPYGIFDKWISTFHKFCDRILKNHGLDIGLNPNYRLINTTESWLLLKKNLYKLHLDYYRPKGNPTQFIHALIKLFSRLKDENISPEDYLAYAEGKVANQDNTMADVSVQLEIARIKETADVYFQYQQLLLDNNLLDFGDLIFYMNKLFVQRPNVLKTYQNQFKFILVDEFQDTNFAQYNLIKLLSNNSTAITVVGDDDQAIYKFRGASVSNILNFKKDFKGSKEIVLTKNYRSTQNILDTAYHFIVHNNPDRLEYQLNHPDEYYKEKADIIVEKINKKLTAAREVNNGRVELVIANNEREEVEKIIKTIKELLNNSSLTYSDFAILVRANKTAEPFIKAFERANIPYLYMARSGLYKQDIIMDLLAYTRVLFDRNDAPSLTRVLLIPVFEIPMDEILVINAWAKRKSSTLFETLKNIRQIKAVPQTSIQKIEHLLSLINAHTKVAKENPAIEALLQIITDIKYREYLLSIEKNDPEKAYQLIGFVNMFLRKMDEFKRNYEEKSLSVFVEYTDLEREAGDTGGLEPIAGEQGPDAVKIMTIHGSKGLEFTYVFIPQLVEERFPSTSRSDLIELPDEIVETREILPEGDIHLQEERRLFYVALTRAKKGIFISYAADYGGKRAKKPSQFLFESQLIKEKTPPITITFNNNLIQTLESLKNDAGGQTPYRYPIPKEFSYSQIAAFKTCPLQYKYQFILHIPQDKGRPSFSFGQTMHSTLLELFKRIKSRKNATQGMLFAAPPPQPEEAAKNLINLEEIYRIYDEHWIDEWYESDEAKKDYYESGKKILKEFFELNQENWPDPLFLEHDFKIYLNGTILKGRIDRIDKVRDNNGTPEVEIIDYKTSKFKEKVYGEDKLQLIIYQMALRTQGLKPVKLKYYYLHEDRQGSFEFLANEKELEKTHDDLINTIEKIKKGEFPANPSEFNCKYCDFKNICPFSAV